MTTTSHTTTRTPAHACPFPETGCTANSCPHTLRPSISPAVARAAVQSITNAAAATVTEDYRRALARRALARSRAW